MRAVKRLMAIGQLISNCSQNHLLSLFKAKLKFSFYGKFDVGFTSLYKQNVLIIGLLKDGNCHFAGVFTLNSNNNICYIQLQIRQFVNIVYECSPRSR